MTRPVLAEYEQLQGMSVADLHELVANAETSLSVCMMVLWQLRERDEPAAVDALLAAFAAHSSPLLRHEIAYIVGQKQDVRGLEFLTHTLTNALEDPMVRHEAAEAIGAFGRTESVRILSSFLEDTSALVRETCDLALHRIQFVANPAPGSATGESAHADEEFASIDPAPALDDDASGSADIEALKAALLDERLPLWDRYRAMFSLRNRRAVKELCAGLFDKSSALFRHEVAFVLGQLEHPSSFEDLAAVLRTPSEDAIVRHECAEAIGALATPAGLDLLREFCNDPAPAVRDSCIVALDMHEYWTGFYQKFSDAPADLDAAAT